MAAFGLLGPCSFLFFILVSGRFLKLRAAIIRVVWSRKQPLASAGCCFGLLDGPQGCDPSFCLVWLRFRLFCKHLSFRPGEVDRVYRLLDQVQGVALVMVRCMLWPLVLDALVFYGTLECQGGGVKGCPGLVTWLVPFSILGLPFLMIGKSRVSAGLCAKSRFQGALCWIFVPHISSLPFLMSVVIFFWIARTVLPLRFVKILRFMIS